MESPANRPADLNGELDPALRPRRRSVRQKVHIPAYANLNGSRNGMMLDLNEIIDISEDGICIQTSSPLTTNHSLPVSLDLAETRTFIDTTGHVVWTDKSGRAGMHFPEMPPQFTAAVEGMAFRQCYRRLRESRGPKVSSIVFLPPRRSPRNSR